MLSRRWVLSPLITAGFALAFVLLLVAGGLGYRVVELSTAMAAEARQARDVLDASQQVLIRLDRRRDVRAKELPPWRAPLTTWRPHVRKHRGL